MTEELQTGSPAKPKKGFSGMQVLGIIFASMLITAIATGFAIKLFLFPSPFKPVELSNKESQVLAAKLDRFEGFGQGQQPTNPAKEHDKDGNLIPEKYDEAGMSRDIKFTERELNSMVAKNTDMADKVAIDLAADMVSVKILIPLDPDFPMLGGKTLKVKAGAELAYRDGRPVVKLRGVSLMGVPMPNAWLGGMKNIDLIEQFGTDEGFWKSFGDGVDSIEVVDGFLKIQLKE